MESLQKSEPTVAIHPLVNSMIYSPRRHDDYANQGQQDDYFDQDVAIAGHEQNRAHPAQQEIEDYQNQGQQDDDFDQDLVKDDRLQP